MDVFTTPSGQTYRVTVIGGFERKEKDGAFTPLRVKSTLGAGQLTLDHGTTVSRIRIQLNVKGASLTVKQNGVERTVKALRGVQIGDHGYAVFVSTPAYEPDDVSSITRVVGPDTYTVHR